jgi:N-acetylneuraminic acid mutarotase
VVNGLLYAVGGEDTATISYPSYMPTVEAYNPTTDTWTAKAPMPTARAGLAVGVIDGVLYALGGGCEGIARGNPMPTVEAYDPDTDSWTTRAAMPTVSCGGLSAGVVKGILYTVAGDGPGQSALLAYDPATDLWSRKTSMPVQRPCCRGASPRWGAAAGVANNTLYVVGGYPGQKRIK